MLCSDLYQTSFHIDKLMNAVNVGKGSAFQVLTTRGELLGQIGYITDQALRPAANEVIASSERPRNHAESKRSSWFRRLLASLKR